jgi:hypothetical protein
MFSQTTIEKDLMDWVKGMRKYANIQEEMSILSKYHNITNRQWTGKFGEHLVKHLLQLQGHIVCEQPLVGTFNLDLETNDALYEVKTRNYSTSGTIGEKILGTPYRYSNVVTRKPIYIVLVGYQEREAQDTYELFNADGNRRRIIELWESMGIHYVRCSDLLIKAQHSLMLRELVQRRPLL